MPIGKKEGGTGGEIHTRADFRVFGTGKQ